MKFTVTGMTCAACSARVERAVRGLKGITSCSVNLLTETMLCDGSASPEQIINAVEKAGYGAYVYGAYKKENGNKKRLPIGRLVASLCLSFAIMYLGMGHNMWHFPLPEFVNASMCASLQGVLCLATILINYRYFANGFKGILNLSPNMDTLVSIGSGVSFLQSICVTYLIFKGENRIGELYFESSAMILALINVGKTLEAYSKGKTTDAISSLIKLKPQRAVIIENNVEKETDASLVKKGDIVVIKAGSTAPADGRVISGYGSFNEAALTGESLPADKKEGDYVSASTVCFSGYLHIKAEKVGDDTAFGRIIQTVIDASGTKAPIARLADKISAFFVPAVMAIGLITFGIWLAIGASVGEALERGISVLVISCPCALGLATPVAVMVGSGVGAKNGILFKNAAAIEEAGRIKKIALDKTGTVTTGELKVTDVISDNPEQLMRLAYAVENKSDHPIARAICRYAEEHGAALTECSDFNALPGGIKATLDGCEVLAGNASFTDIKPDDTLAKQGKTPIFFTKNGECAGIIAVSDTVKPDSREAIETLKKAGIKVIMLTGDNETTANAIGQGLGVDEVIAGVTPEGKAEKIKNLGEHTAMIGDGINDAPALTTASLGIAIGTGTDVAIDSAQVLLMGGSLTEVYGAVYLGRCVLRNIRQNLMWAFLYNILGIPLAAGVLAPLNFYMTPMLGALAMSLSSVCVVTNALRLNTIKLKKEKKKMTRTIKIEGMMCGHCEARVKKLLEELPQVDEAVCSHISGTAVLTLNAPVDDATLKKIIEDDGYKFIG